MILHHLKNYFPNAPTYNRFVELIPRCIPLMILFFFEELKGKETGRYYIDSKKLSVCENPRIFSHRVFSGIAKRGKTSVGWFYGFKLFLVINHKGEIMNFTVTAGNKADNDVKNCLKLLNGLKGKVYGDRGFISKELTEKCMEQGIKIVTKIKRNMKNKLIEIEDKMMLSKRGIIESVFNILELICNIEHTRHRSVWNFMSHICSGIVAYSFIDKKPTIEKNYKFLAA
jgi:hypothetical protein